MLKKQRILVGVACFLTIILWTLPKVVVENDAIALSNQMEDKFTPQDTHNANVSSQNRTIIDSLVVSLKENNSPAISIHLDSLIAIFKHLNLYDSAAFYAEYFAENNPSQESFAKAGNLYYEAFTFAISKEKEKFLGEKTRTLLGKAQSLGKENLDWQVKIGMTLVSTSAPMQGIQMIRDVLVKNPNHQLALFNLGVLAMQSGQFDKAIERFEKLKSIDSTDIQARFYLGICQYELKSYKQARIELEAVKALTQEPEILATVNNYLQKIPIP